MTNVPLIFQPLVKYAEFNGRSRRSEFWLWVLLRFIIGGVLGAVMLFVLGSSLPFAESQPQAFMSRYMTTMPIIQLVNLALLLPSLAVSVRRLHDTNRSGWWILMPLAVTIAGLILFFIFFGTSLLQLRATYGDNSMTDAQGLEFLMKFLGSLMLCVVLPALISNIVMLVFYVTDGTPGPNRFGADPRDAATLPFSRREYAASATLLRYADFNGRSSRGEFWAFTLLTWIVYVGLYAWVLTPLLPLLQGGTPGADIFSHLIVSIGVMCLVGLLLFLPVIAVQVRRLHDSNRTGWWVALPTAFSMAGQHLSYVFHSKAILTETMKAGNAIEAMAGSTFNLAEVWAAYWPLYQIILPWALGPSLLAYLVLLVFYAWPGTRGDNRFGPNPRLSQST